MTGPAILAKKAMRHKVIATRLAAEGLPLPVPLDAVVRNLRPMPLALDTGTAWKVWAAARGYADDHLEALMSALPSLVASTGYLIEVSRAGSRRWDADGNAVGEVSDEHRRAAADRLTDRKARREAGTAVKATKVVSEAQERVPKPSGVIGQPEPPSAPTASQPVAVTEEMATAGQTMLGMDGVKPRRPDPVIEVRRSAKVHPGPLLRKGVAPRPAAVATKPPSPVAPMPTLIVVGDVFQRVTTRRHTLRLVQLWTRQPAGAALIEMERAAVLADVRAELKREGLGCPPLTEAAIREKLADLLLGIERRTV
jgi:hypothetical protein